MKNKIRYPLYICLFFLCGVGIQGVFLFRNPAFETYGLFEWTVQIVYYLVFILVGIFGANVDNKEGTNNQNRN
jgi:hypothetical protein